MAIEALTALVGQRDGGNGSITTLSRQVNVLQEIGVEKGQYLGFLPTIIKYALASLNTFLALKKTNQNVPQINDQIETSDFGLDIGLAFIDASKPSPIPSHEQIE